MDFLTPLYLLLPIVITIMVGVLLLAFLTSIVGLINAWFGDVEIAKWIGWGTAVPGGILGILVGVAVVAFDPDAPTFPWVCMIPVVMGALTLAHVYAVRVPGNVSRFQFTMPTILYVMLLTGLLGVGVRLWMADYTDYSMRDEFEANLQRSDQIENVNVIGHVVDDRFYVEEIEFSLAGRPDSLIRVSADPKFQNCSPNHTLDYILIEQIGHWKIDGRGYLVGNQGKLATYWDSPGLLVGKLGPHRDDFPFRLASIGDLIAHYDEVIEVLETWPDRSDPHKAFFGDEVIVESWVKENAAATRYRSTESAWPP